MISPLGRSIGVLERRLLNPSSTRRSTFGCELRETNRMSLVLIVLVDFEHVLSRSTFVECSFVLDHLQVTLGTTGELLIQTLFPGSP